MDPAHALDNSDGESVSDSDSILNDVIGAAVDPSFFDDPLGCTLSDAIELRRLLHSRGKASFLLDRWVSSFPPLKLCTAFGIPQFFVAEKSEKQLLGILSQALDSEINVRSKLLYFNTVDDVVEALQISRRIVVLSGAGISTSLGIPDFRSHGSGLYAKLAHLGLSDPQEVFSMSLFKEDPSLFYSIAKFVYPPTLGKFTPTHAFIRLLQDKGKLLTNYSQNIDNVEAAAGILKENLIQCHGSFRKASCLKCKTQVPGQSIAPQIKNGEVPRCTACLRVNGLEKKKKKRRSKVAASKKRKRANSWEDDSDEEDDEAFTIEEPGVMKPDITFFDERLPERYFERLERDRKFADLIVVIGTSLQVDPVNNDIVTRFPRHIPQVYINLKPVDDFNLDVQLLGKSDVVVSEICRRAGWALTHELIPKDEVVNVEPVEGQLGRYAFSA